MCSLSRCSLSKHFGHHSEFGTHGCRRDFCQSSNSKQLSSAAVYTPGKAGNSDGRPTRRRIIGLDICCRRKHCCHNIDSLLHGPAGLLISPAEEKFHDQTDSGIRGVFLPVIGRGKNAKPEREKRIPILMPICDA
jgi:hypothetical protein